LRASLIEEAYEVVDAIEREHSADLEEELGDLLINILMQAQIAAEQEAFTLDSIAGTAAEKLVRRHPHVFGESTLNSSSEVLTQWEEIKRAERAAKGLLEEEKASLLDGVARAFPALVRAQKIQKKAANARFDWECAADVAEKASKSRRNGCEATAGRAIPNPESLFQERARDRGDRRSALRRGESLPFPENRCRGGTPGGDG
jgi:MazG family protein